MVLQMKRNIVPTSNGVAGSPQLLRDEWGANLRGEECTSVIPAPLFEIEAVKCFETAKTVYADVFPLFQKFTRDLPFRVILEGRVKALDSILEKARRKRRSPWTFSDLIGIRLTVESKNFRFLTSKLSQWLRRESFEVLKVEIKLPNSHMDYSAVHWDLRFRGFPVELQLMTPSQRKWALTAHDTLYKGLKNCDLEKVEHLLKEIHRERERELEGLFY